MFQLILRVRKYNYSLRIGIKLDSRIDCIELWIELLIPDDSLSDWSIVYRWAPSQSGFHTSYHIGYVPSLSLSLARIIDISSDTFPMIDILSSSSFYSSYSSSSTSTSISAISLPFAALMHKRWGKSKAYSSRWCHHLHGNHLAIKGKWPIDVAGCHVITMAIASLTQDGLGGGGEGGYSLWEV